MKFIPKVSVIVSVYKSEKFIRGKLDDLLAQTIIEQVEIIIINSGSPEGEHAIIQEYIPLIPHCRYIRTEMRESIYQAWNRGIGCASGTYITNANTDDRLAADALEVMSEYLETHSQIDICYADQLFSFTPNETLQSAKKNPVFYCSEFSALRLMDICIIGSQPMWRSSLHTKHKLFFNPDLEISGDHDFYLRALSVSKFAKINNYISGTFYKPLDNSNKEAQNKSASFLEGNKVTLKNIQLLEQKAFYLSNLPEMRLMTQLPFSFFRFWRKLQTILTKNHVLNYEFVFLCVALYHYRYKRFEDAIVVAQKFLSVAPSIRLEAVIRASEKKQEGEITI